jgi:uncharacterized phage-like protein YoqJ
MEKSICFTGHRKLPEKEKALIRQELRRILEAAIRVGYVHFYAGGARGWDTLCAKEVLQLKEHSPEIKLHLVLPCPMEEQTLKWSVADRRSYEEILILADTVEILCEGYTKTCMQERNQRLVDMADFCVCYYDEGRWRSGTGQTVRMATRKGIPIINIMTLTQEEENKT